MVPLPPNVFVNRDLSATGCSPGFPLVPGSGPGLQHSPEGVNPGGSKNILISQLRSLFQRGWRVGSLGVADFLVPGLEVGVDAFLAQQVQAGWLFLQEDLLVPVREFSCRRLAAINHLFPGNTWPLLPGPPPGARVACRRSGDLPRPAVSSAGCSTPLFTRSWAMPTRPRGR